MQKSSTLLNEVATKLAALPEAQEAALAIVEDVNAFFAEIAPQHRDDLSVQQGYWESLRLLSDLVDIRGEHERAVELMQQSHALVERAAERWSDDVNVAFQLGYSFLNLSTVTFPDDAKGSEKHLRRAAEVLGDVVERADDVAVHHYHYAGALQQMSQRTDNPQRIIEYQQDAVRHGERAVALAPAHAT